MVVLNFMTTLSFPFTEEKIRALKVGDEVLISGVIHTGRDAVHKYLHEGGQLPPGVSLRDGILYHCGPVVMKQEDGSWKATAAGPTGTRSGGSEWPRGGSFTSKANNSARMTPSEIGTSMLSAPARMERAALSKNGMPA